MLASAGAAAYWMVNLAISLTPLATEYRTSLSIDYAPMLFEAALGGLLIALLVSRVLLHFPGWIPARSPMSRSVVTSVVVLLVT